MENGNKIRLLQKRTKLVFFYLNIYLHSKEKLENFIKSKKEFYYLNFQPPAENNVNINAFRLKTCSFGFKYNAPWLVVYEDDMVL